MTGPVSLLRSVGSERAPRNRRGDRPPRRLTPRRRGSRARAARRRRALDEVAEAVAPYELPAELRRFWERVDAERMERVHLPETRRTCECPPRFEPDLRENGAPPVLLPVDYASHCYGVIELRSEWSEGGTILEWDLDAFPLVAHSVADRIAVLAELVSEGRFERGDGYVVTRSSSRAGEAARDASTRSALTRCTATCARSRTSSRRGRPTGSSTSGIDLGDREPSARRTRSRSSLPQRGEGRVTGRIHGEVTRLIGTGRRDAGRGGRRDEGHRRLVPGRYEPVGAGPWTAFRVRGHHRGPGRRPARPRHAPR